jgi:MSHA pilin protein MshC
VDASVEAQSALKKAPAGAFLLLAKRMLIFRTPKAGLPSISVCSGRISPRQCHASWHRGFTLIELIASLVILAILVAMAAPALLDHRAFSERGYADELADAIRYTQRIAVASGCTTRIVIAAGNYSAQQRNTCNGGGWNRILIKGDGSQVSGTAPAGVLANPNRTITFDASGNVAGAVPGNTTIGAFTLSLDPLSNIVTVS